MSKKKHKVTTPQVAKTPEKYIKEAARKLPIHECWEANIGTGLATVIVSRIKRNGNFVVGIYLIDIYCLGVKNCMYKHDLDEVEYKNILNKLRHEKQDLIPCTPTRAFNLVYGALEYAEDLGFSPQKDFDVAEYILDPADEIEFEEIEFGMNGKPTYFSGPYDNVTKIISTLEKSVGVGNFDVVHQFGDGSFNFDGEDDDWDDEDEDEDEEEEDNDGEYVDFEEVKK